MLRETFRFRNYAGLSDRRLFTDSDMDLYVWFNGEAPERFHLIFNKQASPHSVSWNNETGFEQRQRAPVEALAMMTGFAELLDTFIEHDTGDTQASVLAHRFLHASSRMTPWLADFIYARLLEYPGRNAGRIDPGTALRSF